MSRTVRSTPALPASPPRPGRPAPALEPLEVARGLAFGADPATAPDAQPGSGTVAGALDASMLNALRRSPCLVSFSGGRDSSALLAWATRLARREGLSLPVPATLVIPGDSDADESDWQDHVLDHLGLTERVMIEVGHELDCVGPVATAALSRHGLLWPFNTHMHIPIFAAAEGGSVITGFAGDELGRSSAEAVSAAQVLTGKRRPNRDDPLVVGFALAPPPLRRAISRRRNARTFDELVWLRPAARLELGRLTGDHDAAVPRRWSRVLTDWWPNRRYFRIVAESLTVAAEPWDVRVANPFNDPGVHAALAARGGWGGLGSRRQLLTEIFGDVLPASVLARRSKATFSNVLFTDTARRFAAQWSGHGVDETLIDVAALRQHWARPEAADMRSMALLQTAWLHDYREGLADIS